MAASDTDDVIVVLLANRAIGVLSALGADRPMEELRLRAGQLLSVESEL